MPPANDPPAPWFAEWLAAFAARGKKMAPSWVSRGVSISRLYHSTVANRTTVNAETAPPYRTVLTYRPTTGRRSRADAPDNPSLRDPNHVNLTESRLE